MSKNDCKLCGLILLLLLTSLGSFAQQIVTGMVRGANDSLPVVAATVTVKGTNIATVSDIKGNFTITVPSGKHLLVVSSVGFTDVEVDPSSGNLNVLLSESTTSLNDVVVVGYGTQKKSVVTGAISSVKAKDLENVPSSGRIEQALQGRVSGVTIAQNAGQPGSNATIRVRGITTFDDAGNNPLWVIDGIVVDAGGIGYINQSDIESIEVLKDATSAAIYGTRAASGVILVTTKKGRAGKISFSYNGLYGTSAPAKKLDLLNATEYATLMNERSVAGGGDIVYSDPASLGNGTDWQAQIFNDDARRSDNEFSISGGGDKSTFYLSFGLLNQQGIVSTDISQYDRKNIRLNSTHKINKFFTFGETVGYAHAKSIGLGNTNSEYGGPLSSAINLDPITPLIETDSAVLKQAPYLNNAVILAPNGYPYGISTIVGQEMSNPKAYEQTRLGNYNWSDDFVGNAYLEIKPTQNITIRSSIGGKLAYWGSQGFTPVYYLSPTINVTQNNLSRNSNKVFYWNIENTIQYSKIIDDHNFSILLGQGAYVDNIGGSSTVTVFNLPVNNYQDASFNFPSTQANRTDGVSDFTEHKISSLFGRVNYNYKEKYLFTGIIRRDGSTRFGSNNKFGNFPSASVGWVASREDFWPTNKVVNTFKLRGGYGKVGNDGGIPDFSYTPLVVGGYNYTIGNGGTILTGYAPKTLANPDLHWEETTQADVGFDAQVLTNFTLTVDVYNKKTSGILRPVPIPLYVGVSDQPAANIADMENRGLEIELGYHKRIGQVDLGINGNVSFLKNEVTYVNSDADFIDGGAGFQSMGTVTRIQVGQSFNSFYGYKTMGIFQTQADVNAYVNKDGGLIQPNAKPGDFRWADLNGDGTISEDDKTFLGSNIPKETFGLTVTAAYKGFDVMIFGQGAAGNKIFQGLRRLDIANANYQTKALDRWAGPGTSNDFPRLTSSDDNGNFQKMSDFYLESGDYLRLKLLQLGYTFNNNFLSRIGCTKLRLYVTGENLVTLTNYTGYDPEIGGGVFGIDKGYYPQARSFLVGAQIQF